MANTDFFSIQTSISLEVRPLNTKDSRATSWLSWRSALTDEWYLPWFRKRYSVAVLGL